MKSITLLIGCAAISFAAFSFGQTPELSPEASFEWTKKPAKALDSPAEGAAEALPNCNNFTTITCGSSLTNQSTGTVSNFNQFVIGGYVYSFPGADKLYKLTISQQSAIRIVLDIITPNTDLDLIILTDCVNSTVARASLEDNVSTGISRESWSGNIGIGTYWVVVDANSGTNAQFNLSVNCTCTCVEAANDMPNASKLFCDNFQDYLVNKGLDVQCTQWRRWKSASLDATVETWSGETAARFKHNGTAGSDLIYLLDGSTTTKNRLSWRMFIPTGKSGYFNILHTIPNYSDGSGANYAVQVYFNSDGTGYAQIPTAVIGDPPLTVPFVYQPNQWFDVVVVLTPPIPFGTNRVANLFIGNDFVSKWDFQNTLSATQTYAIAGVDFYAIANSDYYIDNVCFWKELNPCNVTTEEAPVCMKNGDQYGNPSKARCALFTSKEWFDCSNICDLGGNFVYRGFQQNGTLDASDFVFNTDGTGCISNNGTPYVMDVYVFNKDDNKEVQFAGSGGNTYNITFGQTQLFIVTCKSKISASGPCIFQQRTCDDPNDPLYAPCNDLYYIVAIGPAGESYDFTIVPEGTCTPNSAEQLTFTNNSVTDNDVVSASPNTTFSRAGGAYSDCYDNNGPYEYIGGEKTYQFTLNQPSTVTLSLTSSVEMGAFLYSFLCGQNCIGYVENSLSSPTAKPLTINLADGTYYIVVDKNTTTGSKNFSLNLQIDPFSPFINSTMANMPCPVNPALSHTVEISNFAYNFSPADQIHFLYRDGNVAKSSDNLNAYWHGLNTPMSFNIKQDLTGDGMKCSYLPNDSFLIFLVRTDNGKRVFREMKPTYRAGTTANKFFQVGGQSIIDKLEVKNTTAFGSQTLELNPSRGGGDQTIPFSTSLGWNSELQPASASSWIKNISPASSDGAEEISLHFDANPNEAPRSAVFKITSATKPDLFSQAIKISQKGICNPNPTLSVTASATQICNGSSVSLTATVGAGLDNLYSYKWSTGETTQSITQTPTTNTAFIVTITNDYCHVSKSAQQTITVNPLPNPPTVASNAPVCEGSTPVLSVTNVSGITVNWFAAASGGASLQTGNSYSPTGLAAGSYTFFAEASTSFGCKSTSRTPVSLLVKPKPTLTNSTPLCSTDLQTWSVNLTTAAANSLTVSAGMQSGSNGNFSVVNIPKAQNLTATVVGSNGCSIQQVITAPSCACPTVNLPSPLSGDKTICSNENIPTLSVSVGAGETADWYSASTGGAVLQSNSTTFLPNAAGTYYAETRNTTTNCTSSSRLAVVLTINPLPEILVSNKICSANLLNYSLTATLVNGNSLTSSLGSPSGSGPFQISNIPSGQNVVLTATNTTTGCIFSKTEIFPDCGCASQPAVNPPTAGPNQTICEGQPIPSLSVTVGSGELVDWFNAAGQLIFTGNPFQPTEAGDFFAQARNSANGCVSATKTKMTLVINPLPTLLIEKTECAPNLLTYFINLNSTATEITASSGTVSGGSGSFQITGIGPTTNVTITAKFIATGCSRSQTVSAPGCPCPTVNKPISGGDKTMCLGQPIPSLSVIVGPDESAVWFDASMNKILDGPTVFTPSTATTATFFVQTKNKTNLCLSNEKTAITLTKNDPPSLAVNNPTCDANLLTYSVSLTTNASIVNSSAGTVTAGGGGFFTVSGISISTGANLTAINSTTGCSAAFSVNPPTCNCSVIGFPAAPQAASGDKTICSGQPNPTLSVSVNTNETANWFNQFGVQVASGMTSFLPTSMVTDTFFVETENQLNHCKSLSKTKVTLTINPRPILSLDTIICSADRLFYNAVVQTTGDKPVATGFTVIANGGGFFTIANIPVGTAVVAKSKFASTGCQSELPIFQADCPCLSSSAPLAVSGGDKIICQNDPIPSLSVMVGAGLTADWFDQETGGFVFPNGIGTTTFQPTGAGIFYAQTRNTVSDCVSPFRTPVSLKIDTLPTVVAGANKTICSGETIQLAGSITRSTGGQWSASVVGGSFFPDNNFLTATSYQPPSGVSSVTLTLTCTDPAGPCGAVSSQQILTILPPPTIHLDSAFCEANLDFYAVVFSTNVSVFSISAGQLMSLGNGKYRVDNVPKATDLQVFIKDLSTNCVNQLTVAALNNTCSCPFQNPPKSLGDVAVCSGKPLPPVVVEAIAGKQIDWYDAAVGGMLLKENSAAFFPNQAGTFYAEIVDLLNPLCKSASRTAVSLKINQTPTPDAGLDQSICPGGTAMLTAVSTGVSYLWPATNELTQTIFVKPLEETTYTLIVISPEGCSATDSVVVKIWEAPTASLAVVSPIKCFGSATGVLECNPMGGTPLYTIFWATGATTKKVFSLPVGSYSATVTDQNGCSTTAGPLVLTEPPMLSFDPPTVKTTAPSQATGSILLVAQGGTPPFSFKWSDGSFLLSETTNFLQQLGAGDYFATVTDANGCTLAIGPIHIGEVETGEPNWASLVRLFPNPTTGELFLKLDLPEFSPLELDVLDVLGRPVFHQNLEKIKETTLPIDLSAQPDGCYFIKIKLENEQIARRVTRHRL